MKKVLFTIVFGCFFVAVSVAQTQQGSFLAGGTISLAFEKEKSKTDASTVDGDSHTNISFAPLGGIFFADGMVAGAGINVGISSSETDDGSVKNTTTSLGLMPFFRYYHDSGLFGHGSIELGTAKFKSESGGTTTESDLGVFAFEVGPGYAIFLNENVAIEGLLTYGSRTLSVKDSPSDLKDITTGILIRFGFTVFIN